MGNHPGGVEPPGALKHDAARDQHPEMVWGSLLMLARLSVSASSTSGLRYAPVYRAFYQQLVFKRSARERIKSENGGIYALCGQTGAQLPLTVTGAASPPHYLSVALTTTLRCSAKHLHRAPLHWQQWSACLLPRHQENSRNVILLLRFSAAR